MEVANAKRRQNPDLEKRLTEEPHRFEFFQAVRLLEQFDSQRAPVGEDALAGNELVRFGALPSLTYPATQIANLVRAGSDEAPSGPPEQPEMTVTFMGLTGPCGVLPLHYTALLIERCQERPPDLALREFLDIFHHRAISLFYRAWAKYRLPIALEQHAIRQLRTRRDSKAIDDDLFTYSLAALVGMSGRAVRDRMHADRESVIYYSGHFAHNPRSAVALELLLADYFGVDVRIEQFLGQWLKLELGDQSRLPRLGEAQGRHQQVGETAMIGSRFWSKQTKFRVRIGPVGYDQFTQFFPDAGGMARLTDLVRLYAGEQLDFDVQVVLLRNEVPGAQLSLEEARSNRLGWDCWLKDSEFTSDAQDAVFCLR